MSAKTPETQPKQLPTGVLEYEGNTYPFQVLRGHPLSLDLKFPDRVPELGVVLDRAAVFVNGALVELGRSRLDPPAVEDSTGTTARLAPVREIINCKELLKSGRLTPADQPFEQLPLLFNRKASIKPEFRAFTADAVFDLQLYRSLFDDVDRHLANETPETQAEVQKQIIERQGSSFLQFFDEHLKTLETLVKDFTRQEHERHGFYFRRHVWDMILESAFLARTNIRPRGYAGDATMMLYIYKNTYLGSSIFGKLMHKHPIETAAAQAVRNRRKLLADTLGQERRKRVEQAGRKLRFMSVACGPAWEVRDLFTSAEDCRSYECTLLDQDDEALAEARRAIEATGQKYGVMPNVRWVQDSVRTMLRTNDLAGMVGRHDFIYAMGLFDYLTQPVAKAVLAKLYSVLEPGGRMLIGNFHIGNPTRLYMEYWMDWVLLYRAEEEHLALADGLPGLASKRVFFEDTHSQIFLELVKE